MLAEILADLVVSSRGRRNPRKVKRKMSNYPVRPSFELMPKRIDFAQCISVIK
ncbi:MAG: hypothetical protein IIA40_07525 [SAR324 cluster bacterium]|nr:hypothetical protein [SAR324 cluster bacterium]